MTFEEFIDNVKYQIDLNHYLEKNLREGEMFMLELGKARPDIAQQLAGSMLDPSFKHRITEVVKNFVKDRW
jgi:hypothetical protein